MLIIFDLDFTLIDGRQQPLVGAESALQLLCVYGHTLALASHNSNAAAILRSLGWNGYFSHVEEGCENAFSKKRHLTNILKVLNMQESVACLIDDEPALRREAMSLGIVAVPPEALFLVNGLLDEFLGK